MKQLAADLPDNIRYLSKLIAQKPKMYCAHWAATVDESFLLYTKTNTVGILHSNNLMLSEGGWPFPLFLDIRKETEISGNWGTRRALLWAMLTGSPILQTPLLYTGFGSANERVKKADALMVYAFWRNERRIFDYWLNHKLLRGKEKIISEIRTTYRKSLYAACMPMVLALLDFVMRDYFQAKNLRTSLQTLSNALKEAGIHFSHFTPEHLLHNDIKSYPAANMQNPLPTEIYENLRLPGVFLSSFVEFGSAFYSWHKTTDTHETSALNRHAIMHCATNYWSHINAIKLLIFFDLTIRLERVLQILINGPKWETMMEDE